MKRKFFVTLALVVILSVTVASTAMAAPVACPNCSRTLSGVKCLDMLNYASGLRSCTYVSTSCFIMGDYFYHGYKCTGCSYAGYTSSHLHQERHPYCGRPAIPKCTY